MMCKGQAKAQGGKLDHDIMQWRPLRPNPDAGATVQWRVGAIQWLRAELPFHSKKSHYIQNYYHDQYCLQKTTHYYPARSAEDPL